MLKRRGFLGGVAAGALASLSSGGAFTAGAQTPISISAGGGDRRNLVLFVADELRADALACYGNPLVKTPNFDRLASEGTRFAQCSTAFPICGPARCSLLTGWPTHVRGHRSQMYFLRPDEPNLFRYLKESGYDVFWFGKNDALAAQCFDDSVTRWNYADDRMIAIASEGVARDRGALSGLGGTMGDRRETSDYACVRAAIEVMEETQRDRPFCLFLPLLAPHPPYTAPDGFADMYRPADVPTLIPPDLPRRPAYLSAIRERNGLNRESADTFRRMRAAYLGKVSFSDWLLGEVLEALDRTGRSRDTVVYACSDHGDYAGDYGMGEKWPGGLEACLTHVPLIVREPGASRGRVVREQTQLMDIMATCASQSGVSLRHTHFARDLTPLLRGGAEDPGRAGFSECGYNTYEPQCFEPGAGGAARHKSSDAAPAAKKARLEIEHPELIARGASIQTSEYRFVRRPQGQSEFYLLADDPKQLHNRYGDRDAQHLQNAAEQRLLDWYLETSGVAPWDRDQREFPPYLPQPHLNVSQK